MMALQPYKKEISLIDHNVDQPAAKKANIILDEDSYVQKIEKIIERDFFPDLPKLNIQKSYFDALDQNDLVKLRELQMKYGGPCPSTGARSSVCDSPATFETPDSRSEQAREKKTQLAADKRPQGESRKEEAPTAPNQNQADGEAQPGLDSFFAKHTSEDNASFADILNESEKQRREKHSWLFQKEAEQSKEQRSMLALPSMEEQAAITQRPFNVDTWTYTPDNTVMYVPQGVDRTAKELIELRKQKTRQVVHANTHFTENPFGKAGSKEVLQKAAVQKALINQGKIGHDGRELLTGQTPQINGLKLLRTPSPAPGVEDSPLMTWGEVEGTPITLDAQPNFTPGPVFRIPAVPKRDKIALALAEKNSKAHRAKKEEAIKQVTRRLTSPTSSMSPLERLHNMSPAAQSLASKRLGVRTHSQSALRASYTPSPTRNSADKTPLYRSSPSPGRFSSSRPSPSKRSPRPRKSTTPKVSITDNLLKLPPRRQASDFF